MKAAFDTEQDHMIIVFQPENTTETMALLRWGQAFGIEVRKGGQPGFTLPSPALIAAREERAARHKAEFERHEREMGRSIAEPAQGRT